MTTETDTIVVMGAGGMLGRQVVRAAQRQNLGVVRLGHEACDITNVRQVEKWLCPHPGAIVINCAGILPERIVSDEVMQNVNAGGPHILARYAGRLVQVSTDCVFDGRPPSHVGAYTESSVTLPQDRYSTTKLAGEVTDGPHLTVRGSFVGLGKRGRIQWLLDQPRGAQVLGFVNSYWNGSYVGTFAEYLVAVAMSREVTGLLHLPGPATLSLHRVLDLIARRLRPDVTVVEARAARQKKMILASTRREPMGVSWDQMLAQLEHDYRQHDRQVPGRDGEGRMGKVKDGEGWSEHERRTDGSDPRGAEGATHPLAG